MFELAWFCGTDSNSSGYTGDGSSLQTGSHHSISSLLQTAKLASVLAALIDYAKSRRVLLNMERKNTQKPFPLLHFKQSIFP